jgi:hypothetical protein
MNEQRLRHLLHALAEEMAPDSIDLYPAIRARISPKKRVSRGATFWTLALRMGVVVIAFATLLGLARQDGTATTRWSLPGSMALLPPAASLQPLSLAEAQRRVPFDIHRPTWLPDGLTLAAVFLATPPGTAGADAPPLVVLSYRAPDDAEPSVSLQLSAGPPETGAMGPAPPGRLVTLNDETAVYVHGARQRDGTWDDLADASTLVWTMKRDNVSCVLAQTGLGLGLSEMDRIAASVQ